MKKDGVGRARWLGAMPQRLVRANSSSGVDVPNGPPTFPSRMAECAPPMTGSRPIEPRSELSHSELS